MKKIKIFLASSIHDLRDERNEISSFITRTLKKAFGHTVEFDLEMCEDDTGIVSKTRKQDLYDQYIRESDYLYILFWHDAGEFTVEEFRTAYEQFQKTDKPRIIPFVKLLPEGDKGTEALETFIRYMREELQHYYVEFRHVDTVKLRILLALAQDPELHMTVELKDAQVLVNNQELTDEQDRAAISVENIPFYRNHEGINRLRAEIAELEEQKAAARLAMIENPDDQGAWDKVYAISARWNKLQEELHQYEMQLLETSMRLTKLTADGTYVTLRTKQAVELFDAGKLEEALTVLDMDAFEADLRRAEETAAQSRKQMEALVKELTTRIDILKSQGITKDNAAEIKELYERARTITLKYRLELGCVHGFMNFLYEQNDYHRALQVGDQLYHEYNSRGDVKENVWATFCNSLANLYSGNQRLTEAEELYLEALEIRRRLATANPAVYESDVAMTCNNLAYLYSGNQRSTEAETLYVEAMEIYRRLATANPVAYEPALAATCNNLAILYQNNQRLVEAEALYVEALDIRRRLAAANPAAYEQDVAMACNNLAILYWNHKLPTEAEALYVEALEIFHRLAGINPATCEPAVARASNNLANLYRDNQRLVEAEALYLEALKIYRRLAAANFDGYGSDVALTSNNLANLYRDNQRLVEAEALYLEALKIYRRLVAANPDANEPDLAMICYNLSLFYKQTRSDTAMLLQREAFSIAQKYRETNNHCFIIYNRLQSAVESCERSVSSSDQKRKLFTNITKAVFGRNKK